MYIATHIYFILHNILFKKLKYIETYLSIPQNMKWHSTYKYANILHADQPTKTNLPKYVSEVIFRRKIHKMGIIA